MRAEIEDLIPLRELASGARVLDLGCGSGTIPYDLYPHVNFIGSDCYANAQTARWPANACLALGDAECLPYADGSFEGAVCNFVFEHFSDPRAALRELDRILLPNGFLYISFPLSGSLHDRLYRFALKGGGHLQRYTFESFLAMTYKETGFKLTAYSPMRSGFTWVQHLPYGKLIYRLLFNAFRLWSKAGFDPLEGSDFMMLFHLGDRRGYQPSAMTCAVCGDNAPGQKPGRYWDCPRCSFRNISVPRGA
ncbi:MAG: class I SAM-dependent methyltransferase [Bryobacteraceae bacterium]